MKDGEFEGGCPRKDTEVTSMQVSASLTSGIEQAVVKYLRKQ